jgi:hypothetical protein
MENKLISKIRNHIIHLGLACVLCSVLLGMPLVVHAQEGGPVPAHHFWGQVKTDTGDPAPGVEVTAWIGGEQRGSITTDSSGQYGDDPLTSIPFYLNVTGFNGNIIEFRVNGIVAEEVRWGVLIEEGTPRWEWEDKEPSFQVVYDSAEANGLDLVYTPGAPAENNPPVLGAIGNKVVDEEVQLAFTVSATDADDDPLTLSASPLPSGATFTDNGDKTGSFSWTPSATQGGTTYDILFSVTDGTDSDSEEITITVNDVVAEENEPPVLDAIPDEEVDEQVLLTINVSDYASDPDLDDLEYSFTPSISGASIGLTSGLFSWQPTYSQQGTYNVTFVVSDGIDTASDEIIITVNDVTPPVDNEAPVLDIGDQTVYEGQTLTISGYASDPDGDELEYSATPLPTGATFDEGTGVFSWTPSSGQAGEYDVTFGASDGAEETTEVITITVLADNTPPAAITDLAVSSLTSSSATLTWTAPGDDGNTGTASLYDVRYLQSTSPITESNWASATQASGEPAPQVAGLTETFTVTGLTSSITYHFAIKTADEIPNWSDLSNVIVGTISGGGGGGPIATTTDNTPPAAIADLAVSGVTADSATLTWTAPGDDGDTGTASEYDVRYLEGTIITELNWDSASQASGVPAPQVAGSSETFTVTGLDADTNYHFAVKTADEVPIWSEISNSPSATTSSVVTTEEEEEEEVVTEEEEEVVTEEEEEVVTEEEEEVVTEEEEEEETIEPTPAAFIITNISISPDTPALDETVTITVDVTNTGETEGTYTVVLRINGEVEATQSITLDGGESGEVVFTTTKDEAGDYTVDINGQSASFSVAQPVRLALILGVIGGVILLGLLIYLGRRMYYARM